jgi:DNA-directed RNA polymerase specialized sigma24 family protein
MFRPRAIWPHRQAVRNSGTKGAKKICRKNEALEKLAAVDPRKAELVKLRYFVGLNFEETTAALGIAVPTAKQWWAYARSWLTIEMRGAAPR